MAAKWWVWDVLTGYKASVQLSTADLLSKQFPFWINNEAYEKLLKLAEAPNCLLPKLMNGEIEV